MIIEMPKYGTRVRREKDGQLYDVGPISSDGAVLLYPVWNGRTHKKSITHFLDQYSIFEEKP